MPQTREFASEQAERLLSQLAFHVHRAIQSPRPEVVHDLRVAIRRFAQALAIFEPCFCAKPSKKIRRRLKKILSRAGDVRNCDIAVKLLSRSKAGAAATLLPEFQHERGEAGQILVASLKRWIERNSSSKWRTDLRTETAVPPAMCQEPVEHTARCVLSKMTKDFLDGGAQAAHVHARPADLHKFRIAAKRFRYTLELFLPLGGPALNDWIEKIKTTQRLLGAINDCATVRAMVSRHNGGWELELVLRRRQQKRAEAFRRHWAEGFSNAKEIGLDHPGQFARLGAMKRPAAVSRSATRLPRSYQVAKTS